MTGSACTAGMADFPGEKHFRQWTTSENLPHNTITSALQSASGYIWLGTASGLARFDGYRFINFSMANSGLRNDHITALCETGDGILWIGTDAGGVAIFDHGDWAYHDNRNGLSHNQVQTITRDWQGFVWVGTSYGLNRIGPDDIRIFTEDDGLPDNIITALTVDQSGRLWIGTLQGGLAYFDAEMIHPFGYREGLPVSAITALYTDRLGRIWIGSQQGLFFFDQNEQLYRQIKGTGYTPVTSIAESPSGRIWIATMSDGIKEIRGDSSVTYSPDSGFPDEYVHTLFFDRDTSLWIGTDTHGLLQWLKRPVSMIRLPGYMITGLIRDRNEGVWAGTRNGGLFRITGDRIDRTYSKSNGSPGEQIKALLRDRSDGLWIYSNDAGLIFADNYEFRTILAPNQLIPALVNTLAQDSSGMLWIGTDRGLHYLSGSALSAPLLPDLRIHTLMTDPDGRLFAGTTSGVWRSGGFPDTTFISLAATHSIDVSALFMRPDSILMIGSLGHGLFCLKGDSLYRINQDNGLPDNHLVSISMDKQGNIWIGTYKGIVCLPGEELAGYMDGKSQYLKTTWFDDSEGMASRQCSAVAAPGIALTDGGDLYFATVEGVAHINANEMIRYRSAIETIIERSDPVDLLSSGVLDIQLTAFDYRAPEKIHFRYTIDDPDSDFKYIPPGKGRRIQLAGLDPGDHRLIVQSAGNRSNWHEPPVVLSFTVPLPWYLKPSNMILATGMLIILISAGFFYRKKIENRRLRNKYHTLKLDPDRLACIIEKLQVMMEHDRLYLDADLTIGDLAKQLRIHTNHLSRIINERYGQGFNDYLNRMRIGHVKQLFKDPDNRHKTVLEIMYDAGFNSKSVFNTAFKKFTGTTPTAFRRGLSSPS